MNKTWALPQPLARTAILAVMALTLVSSACSASSSNTTTANSAPEVADTGEFEPAGENVPAPETGDNSVTGLPGVDVDLTNAIAPFDHHSFVDSVLVEIAISQVRTREINECMADEGFQPSEPGKLPERDDPSLVSNLKFPYVERLASQGFVRATSDAPSPDESHEPAPGEVDALIACGEKVEQQGSASTGLQETFGAVRGAWEEVLASIDASEEIANLVLEFGACLRAEGIPPASSDSEGSFLVYVDKLVLEADDAARTAEIDRSMGELYAECGRELFERREQLRGGPLREQFLNEHSAAIQELNDQLFGTGEGS